MGAQLLERVELEREALARLDRENYTKGLELLQGRLVPRAVLLGQRRLRLALHRLAMCSALDVSDLLVASTPATELTLLDLIEDEQVGEALSRFRHRSSRFAR